MGNETDGQTPATDSKRGRLPSTFYVVTTPTLESEMCDIVFESTWDAMLLQGLGGLRHVEAVYENATEASDHGRRLREALPRSTPRSHCGCSGTARR